ncbi:hypothetical protein MRX96_037604 [Rhipicephalus microplus]
MTNRCRDRRPGETASTARESGSALCTKVRDGVVEEPGYPCTEEVTKAAGMRTQTHTYLVVGARCACTRLNADPDDVQYCQLE